MIAITTLHGAEAVPFVGDLANLRIQVFREYPYLYHGSFDYEQGYLAKYFSTPNSVLVVARDERIGNIVGASTAMPLSEAEGEFRAPLDCAGYDPSTIHYFGESVLLPEYRGQGIGHRFFDAREKVARMAGFMITSFCSVVRPDDHPMRPKNYRPHDAFWAKRGYQHHSHLRVLLDWREPEGESEVRHQLSYWIRKW